MSSLKKVLKIRRGPYHFNPPFDLGDATNSTLFTPTTDFEARRPRFDFDEMCLFSKQQQNVLSPAVFESTTAQVFLFRIALL